MNDFLRQHVIFCRVQEPEPDGVVYNGGECPECGENRVDWLIWDELGELVKCDACGHKYNPVADAANA